MQALPRILVPRGQTFEHADFVGAYDDAAVGLGDWDAGEGAGLAGQDRGADLVHLASGFASGRML
jgi:hypothetical protein